MAGGEDGGEDGGDNDGEGGEGVVCLYNCTTTVETCSGGGGVTGWQAT